MSCIAAFSTRKFRTEKNMPRVLVIVVNFNGRKYIGTCLDKIIGQTFQDYTLVVVDNGSTDDSAAYLKTQYSQVNLVILPENIGFSAANNLAIRSGCEEYVALLNADAAPDSKWLQCMVEKMDAEPTAGFAASKMLYHDCPWMIDRAGDGYTVAGAGLLRGRGRPSAEFSATEFTFGACAGAAVYKRAMLDDIGLLDEDFFLLYEDVDLSFRAQLQGYKCIYVPEAVVYHQSSKSIGYDSPTAVYYGHRNIEWAYIKNMPGGLIARTLPWHLLYNLVAFAFFSAKGMARPYLRAKIDAVKRLRKMVQKRKGIQQTVKVSDRYIRSIMDEENFIGRLTRRQEKTEQG